MDLACLGLHGCRFRTALIFIFLYNFNLEIALPGVEFYRIVCSRTFKMPRESTLKDVLANPGCGFFFLCR